MIVVRPSVFSGEVRAMNLPTVTQERLDRWESEGLNIQDAFPELTDDEREFILTGMTPEEWDEAFPEEDD